MKSYALFFSMIWLQTAAERTSTPGPEAYDKMTDGTAMFKDVTQEVFRSSPNSNPVQLNYGIAITDVDNDGENEVIVAGYNGANLVLKFERSTSQFVNLAVDDPISPYYNLRDVGGNAIGVCACDVDGDGKEEIYFLNTNQAYSGMATYSDKLFKFRNGRYEDILSDEVNRNIASFFAGRSVACVDRTGNGRYAIYLANYARGSVGPHSLLEMDEHRSDVGKGKIVLRNVAKEAGVDKLTGGRGVTVGPIVNKDGRSDIFCDNEHGPNFLFRNNGDGTFTDVATEAGVSDSFEHGRGVMLSDLNKNGKIDIVYGNWNGPHRMFIQTEDDDGTVKFRNIASDEFADPSPIRTVIAADFNNDGNTEIFLNNIAYRGPAPNRLFQVLRGIVGQDPQVMELNVGDALEPYGRGTGGAYIDLDGDGHLELILSHGESAEQPLSVYRVNSETYSGYESDHGWLQIRALTVHGAPARGAKVNLFTTEGVQSSVIDAGSGYLCQMEPKAHFGLGAATPIRLEVVFPDTTVRALELGPSDINSQLTVVHPGPGGDTPASSSAQCGNGWNINPQTGLCEDTNECEESPCPPDTVCHNTIGAYACVPNIDCQPGYKAGLRVACIDIDECQETVCDQVCINTPGSYRCGCHEGYRWLFGDIKCTDINECTEMLDECQHICHNNQGGYHCHCHRGYNLNPDRLTCSYGGGLARPWKPVKDTPKIDMRDMAETAVKTEGKKKPQKKAAEAKKKQNQRDRRVNRGRRLDQGRRVEQEKKVDQERRVEQGRKVD